jgi:peptide-methionine (R)-S-oxide reductase
MGECSVELTDEQWRAKLDPSQFAVLREAATERPFTGALLNVHEDGTFHCAGCEALLFTADQKFDSGCGWPSFDAEAGTVVKRLDQSHGMSRTEILCGTCGGHLGHLFTDGPTDTGLRYCVNSLSLSFTPTRPSEPAS